MIAKWYFLIPASLLIMVGCSREKAGFFSPASPEIASKIQNFSLQIPQDDSHFTGAWSGSQFDGSTYRALLSGGGNLLFDLPEGTSTLLLKLRLRAEAPCNLNVDLNTRLLKKIPLRQSPPGEVRLLLPKKLLLPGANTIRFRTETPAKIRFYQISMAPPNTGKPPGTKSGLYPMIQLPARLDYRIRTGGGHFLIRFSQSIPRIEMDITGGGLKPVHRKWSNRSRIKVSISSEPGRFRHMRFNLQGAPVNFRILQSGRILPFPKPEKSKKESLLTTAAQARMNVLIILLDSARADRLSCYGYHRKTTPNIDRLARHGIRFTNAWAEAAYTLASTATLFSGLAPDQHNAVSNYYGGLNRGITTLAEAFQKAGYYTAAVSAIPYCGRAFQMDQGFDRFMELFKQTPQPMAHEFPDIFQKLVKEFQRKNQPYFAYLHVREPHIDYLMKPPYLGTFQKTSTASPNPGFQKRMKNIYFGRAKYAEGNYPPEDIRLLNDAYDENLLSADATIGRLMEILSKNNMADRTVVVILGDHGEGLYEHGQIGHNTVIHPEGLHIPLIISIPGGPARGGSIHHPVFSSDLTATLMREFTGIQIPSLKEKDLFRPRPVPAIVSRSIFFSQYHINWSVMEYPFQAIISGHGDTMSFKIFNLRKDPLAQAPIQNREQNRYFLARLQDILKNRRLTGMTPTASRMRDKEIRSLKSLGYL